MPTSDISIVDLPASRHEVWKHLIRIVLLTIRLQLLHALASLALKHLLYLTRIIQVDISVKAIDRFQLALNANIHALGPLLHLLIKLPTTASSNTLFDSERWLKGHVLRQA